jgi:L-ascorbate metabolism protein UlaG (beta-lactamase superfamily)
MPAPSVLRCYGEGHLALVGEGRPRIDLDPHLPAGLDDRDDALAALRTDFVLLSSGRQRALDDALDLLDASAQAVLVATPALCDRADRLLDLEDRLVDLADWDRVSLGGLTITGLPASRPGLPGADLLPGFDRLPGVDRLPGMDRLPDPTSLLSEATGTLGRALGGLPMLGGLPGAGLLGADRSGGTRRAVHVEIEGGPRVLLAADNLCGGSPDRWLDEVADALSVDVLVASVAGERLDGLVHAVRTLKPRRVVLYRDHDPYEWAGRSQPMARFVEALEEDAPEVDVVHLRVGEELALLAPAGAELPA